MNPVNWLVLGVVFAPLVSMLINLAGNRDFSRMLSGIIASTGMLISSVCAWGLFFAREGTLSWIWYRWIDVELVSVPIGFYVDDLTAIMFLVVTTVAFCVHLYAVEYMFEDDGFQRFFIYLNLFVVSMLVLVGANNLLMMFIGWEGVGLCSYLLIGFWHEEPAPRNAGQKAFIVNRIGDVSFLLGMIYLVTQVHTLEFRVLAESVGNLPDSTLMIVGLLLFGGAVGKSAQFPLHVWLPDAMEGPTPVSSLIHAATMVTAGVYLVARMGFLYTEIVRVGLLIAFVGAGTALVAATMAMVARDMKQILAFSTISQLGYMFVGVGMASYAAGIFHLVTHAFFKGLLFLVAGAVMHALHGELDIFKMGGLSKSMPFTAGVAVIGGLGLAGVPPLAGFWSKDEVLLAAWGEGSGLELLLFGILLITSLLTALYTTRLIVVPFWGSGETHGHEFGGWMNIPMILLAVGTVLGGFMGFWIGHFSYGVVPHGPHGLITGLSVLAVSGGIGLGLVMYQWPVISAGMIQNKLSPVWKLFSEQYYVDQIYRALLVKPLRRSARLFWRLFDDLLIDGFVNLTAAVVDLAGLSLRFTQTGYLRHYLFVISLGIAGILLVFTGVIFL